MSNLGNLLDHTSNYGDNRWKLSKIWWKIDIRYTKNTEHWSKIKKNTSELGNKSMKAIENWSKTPKHVENSSKLTYISNKIVKNWIKNDEIAWKRIDR